MGELSDAARISMVRYYIIEDQLDKKPVEIHYSNCGIVRQRHFESNAQNIPFLSTLCSCTFDETIRHAERIISEQKYTKGWIKAKCCFGQ